MEFFINLPVSGINVAVADHFEINVFYGSFWVAFIWLCIDIEPVFVLLVTEGLRLFERRADFGFHFIQQGSAKVGIVEVIDIAPETVITVAAFRNQAVDMGVPL